MALISIYLFVSPPKLDLKKSSILEPPTHGRQHSKIVADHRVALKLPCVTQYLPVYHSGQTESLQGQGPPLPPGGGWYLPFS